MIKTFLHFMSLGVSFLVSVDSWAQPADGLEAQRASALQNKVYEQAISKKLPEIIISICGKSPNADCINNSKDIKDFLRTTCEDLDGQDTARCLRRAGQVANRILSAGDLGSTSIEKTSNSHLQNRTGQVSFEDLSEIKVSEESWQAELALEQERLAEQNRENSHQYTLEQKSEQRARDNGEPPQEEQKQEQDGVSSKMPLSEVKTSSSIFEYGPLAAIMTWLGERLLLIIILLTGILFFIFRQSIKYADEGVGVFFVDGTDGIITFGSALIAGILSSICAYLLTFESLGFGDYYLFFAACLAGLVAIRTIIQNYSYKYQMFIYLTTKVLMISLAIAVVVIGLVLLWIAFVSRNSKQNEGESGAEYLIRQRSSERLRAQAAAAGASVLAGGVAGAAWSVNRLTMVKDTYPVSLHAIARWFKEGFMFKQDIVNSRP